MISGACKTDFTKDATSYDKISKDERRPLYYFTDCKALLLQASKEDISATFYS